MASRIWIGGQDNNDIYQGNNWSPSGPIQPGDTLQMYSGTTNMAGGDLSGDTLYVGTQTSYATNTPPAIVNLSNGASLTAVAATTAFAQQDIVFNANGLATLNLTIDANYYATMNTTVNLASGSLLRGTVVVEGHNGNLTMNGASQSAFENDGASSVASNSVATINADVLGVGSFAMGAQSALSFMQGVGPRQSVTLSGQNTLEIGTPAAFLGQVNIADGASPFAIELLGITNADSYSFAHDMLTLFQGNQSIDVLRLADSATFQVAENKSGVFIGSSTNSFPPDAVVLPQHGGSSVSTV